MVERTPKHIDLSVILATRNRVATLRGTLDALAGHDVAGLRWEVIVVDNASSDGTPAMLAACSGALPLVILSEPELGKNRAMNRALGAARGELLVFTDDDVRPEPGWLAALHACADRWPDASVFGGVIRPLYPPETPAWLRSHHFARAAFASFEYSQPEGPLAPPLLPFGCNFAVRADVMRRERFLETVGPRGADYPMGGETELLARLRRGGHRIIYVPSAAVGHIVRPQQLAPSWLNGRAYRHGRGLVRLAPPAQYPMLAGAPRWLWRAAATAFLRLQLRRWIGGEEAAFDAAIHYHRLRGELREHRIMATERSMSPPS
jgi:L-malate glycosyltransferase